MDKGTQTRWIKFLGGYNTLFTLVVGCLLALLILIFNTVNFIFQPFLTIVLTILPPMVFALILYYIMNPVVSWLETKKIKRIYGVIGLYIVIGILLVLGIVSLVPVIQNQAIDLYNELPNLYTNFQKTIVDFFNDTPIASNLDQINDAINKAVQEFSDFSGDFLQHGISGIGSVFSAVSTSVITLFTGPIIAFFLLNDPKKFYHSILTIIPPTWRGDFSEGAKIANQQIGAYLKGQIIASLLLGVMYWPVFLLIGLEFSAIIAVFAGIFSIVPYIGSFVAFLPGLFVAFQDSNGMVIKFLIAWFAIQIIHGDLVVPRVMGNRLQIHPITILVVLLVMGDLMGLVGVIFGIPIYTIVKLIVIFIFRKFKQRYNKYYGDKGNYEKTTLSEDDYF